VYLAAPAPISGSTNRFLPPADRARMLRKRRAPGDGSAAQLRPTTGNDDAAHLSAQRRATMTPHISPRNDGQR